jgi:hypothetical protein
MEHSLPSSRRSGAGWTVNQLLGCWRGDLATGPSGGGEPVRLWVFLAVDISQLDAAARLVTGHSDHHGRDCRRVDDSY